LVARLLGLDVGPCPACGTEGSVEERSERPGLQCASCLLVWSNTDLAATCLELSREVAAEQLLGRIERPSIGRGERRNRRGYGSPDPFAHSRAGPRVSGPICPLPPRWATVYSRLKAIAEAEGFPAPPRPLILAGWAFSSDSEKQRRWVQTMKWALANDLLEEVDLPPDAFYRTDGASDS
jgi:hypothetical protein